LFDIDDGNHYDSENSILKIGDPSMNNDVLFGKIVNFNMKLKDVVIQINKIEECKIKNKDYIRTIIWVNKKNGGVCKAYIIY